MSASWRKLQPAGSTTKSWKTCDVAWDGTNVRMIAGVWGGRLYYYNGTSWSEVQPAGNNDKYWITSAIAFDGTNTRILAGVNGGRLYYYNGSTWSEQQPAGDNDIRWKCDIAFDGTNVRMIAGNTLSGRLYYYDGTSWSEQQPAGDNDKDWKAVSIAFDGTNTIMLAGESTVGEGRLYYYNGSTWAEMRPGGDSSLDWHTSSIALSTPDVRMMAGIEKGSLYYYDGSNWNNTGYGYAECCSLAFDGTNTRMFRGSYPGKLYYYNGSTWSEQQPAGSNDRYWSSCSLDFDGTDVVMLACDGYELYYYGEEIASPSASQSPSLSESPSPSATPSPSSSISLSPSVSQSASVSLSESLSPSASRSTSISPSLSPSASESLSPSASQSPSSSISPSPSSSESPSPSPGSPDRYWVGGAGNWNSTDNWSYYSGGSSGATVPDLTNNVIFDANSGLSAGAEVSIDTSASCLSITCSVGASWKLTRTSTNYLSIYESATLESDLTVTSPLYFAQTNPIDDFGGNRAGTFSASGATINEDIHFNIGYELSLGSDLTVTGGSIYFEMTTGLGGAGMGDGWFFADTYNITTDETIYFNGHWNQIHMGSGTWQAFSMILNDGSGESGDPLIFINSETASIKLVNNTATAGEFNIVSSTGAIEFNDIWFTGTGSGGWKITGDYEFDEFKVDGASKTLDFISSPTITANEFNITGSAGVVYTLTSSAGDRWSFSKDFGIVTCDYLILSYSDAIGGAIAWFAGDNSVDVEVDGESTNTGWVFTHSTSASESPSPSSSQSPSASESPSSSISASMSRSVSPSSSISPSPSSSISRSPSASPSSSQSLSVSLSPSSSISLSPSSSISASPSPGGYNTLSVDLFQICFVLVYSDKYSDKTTNYGDKYDRKTTTYSNQYESKPTAYNNKYNKKDTVYKDNYDKKTTTYKVKYKRKSC